MLRLRGGSAAFSVHKQLINRSRRGSGPTIMREAMQREGLKPMIWASVHSCRNHASEFKEEMGNHWGTGRRFRGKSSAARRVLLAMLVGLMLTPFIAAQEQPLQLSTRFEAIPMWGYRSGMSFPIQPSVNGTNANVSLDSGQTYGLTVGMHIRNDDSIQFSWTHQDTNGRVQGVNVAGVQPMDRFHCNFAREYGPWSGTPHAKFFVMSGLGIARIRGTTSTSTQVSLGIGVGEKTLLTPHFGFQVQAEWLPTFLQAQSSSNCSGSCFFHFGGTLASQIGFTMGPIIRF